MTVGDGSWRRPLHARMQHNPILNLLFLLLLLPELLLSHYPCALFHPAVRHKTKEEGPAAMAGAAAFIVA